MFTAPEEVVLDSEQLDFPVNASEREQRWRNKLKYMTLERYAEGLDLNRKALEKDNKSSKSAVELEKEAREKVGKIMARTFDRFRINSTRTISLICSSIQLPPPWIRILNSCPLLISVTLTRK